MPTFIDIGAMDGEEVAWALERSYEVHAFEPNLNCKKYLKQYEDRATINYVAAWYKDGFANLWLMQNPEPGEDGLSLIKEKVNNSKERFAKVPTINIGLYLKKLDKNIDILKINAEGAEYHILESILDHFDHKRIKRWIVEDHLKWIESEEWRSYREKVLKRLVGLNINLEDWEDSNVQLA